MKKIVLHVAFLIVFATSAVNAQLRVDEEALQNIESITLLPIVLPAGVEFDSEQKGVQKARKEIARNLALKGYVLDKPRNWAPPEEWTHEFMKDMNAEEIAQLAPESAEHFAVGFIDNVASSSKVVASKATVRVSARIINRETGKVVWENSESRQTKENAFFDGLFVMALTDDEMIAMYSAFVELFKALPEKEY